MYGFIYTSYQMNSVFQLIMILWFVFRTINVLGFLSVLLLLLAIGY